MWVGPLFVEDLDGESGRFHVHSGRKVYFVDIMEYHTVGWCPCEDFKNNRDPQTRNAMRKPPKFSDAMKMRCKHLKAVHTALGWSMLHKAMRIAYEHETEKKNQERQQQAPEGT